jgi:RHS repeat-associated protein
VLYDPTGRISKLTKGSTTKKYEHLGPRLVIERDASNNITNRYVHGPGDDEPVVWYVGSGLATKRWLHSDERGSVIAISDASGLATAVNRYDEYGIPAATNDGTFQYTGQVWLPELGLYYYKARMYSPTLGRFMQTDPIGYKDGINWYNYVDTDPINATDSDGLQAEMLTAQSVCHGDRACEKSYNSALASIGGAVADVAVGDVFRAILDPTPSKLLAAGVTLIPVGKVFKIGNGVFKGVSLSEAKQLVGRWGSGTFDSLRKSFEYHYPKHGDFNSSFIKYMRQAYNFNKKGATSRVRDDGSTIFRRKNGEYLIERDGKIVSYQPPKELHTGSRIPR